MEAVDLLHYLWKAYKAMPDKDFITYIKDMKSQADGGRATYMVEELMTLAENKYEAHLLNEENSWGQLSEDHEKIVAMSAEIDMLKKSHQPSSNVKTSEKEKKRTNKVAAQVKSKEKENKWADRHATRAKQDHRRWDSSEAGE